MLASLAATFATISSSSCMRRLRPMIPASCAGPSSCRFRCSFSLTSWRRSSALPRIAVSASGSTGFSRKLKAPARMASTARCTLPWPVSTTTSTSAVDLLDPPQQFDAVDVRQQQVRDDGIRTPGAEGLLARRPRSSPCGPPPRWTPAAHEATRASRGSSSMARRRVRLVVDTGTPDQRRLNRTVVQVYATGRWRPASRRRTARRTPRPSPAPSDGPADALGIAQRPGRPLAADRR